MTRTSTQDSTALTASSEWLALRAHRERLAPRHLRELFATHDARGQALLVEAAGWRLDYSKQRVDAAVLEALVALAAARDVPGRIRAMFNGEVVNPTEQRPALHVALRMPPSRTLLVDGTDVVPQVHAMLARMTRFCERVRSGEWTGHDGRRIRTVINIGIGGSDLGPRMAHQALRHYSHGELRVRFVANLDPTDLADATHGLDPAETLFIVSSKSFTTLETLTNARAARAWCLDALGDEAAIARHFVAVSTNAEAVRAFGIDTDLMFGFWDWVGGRYSMDSAIGLSTMLSIGSSHFHDMLAGFHAMDEHFRTAPLAGNLPALMGLLAVWNANFLDAGTVAVLPYAQHLQHLPAYLQQLTMESNGKHMNLAGQRVDHATGPIYWGEPGTNGQHSFFQLLHQGTHTVPCDFIGFARSLQASETQHDALLASMFAQSAALAFGRSRDELLAEGSGTTLAAHRACPGNQPSNTLLAQRLTPFSLGALVAAYEHSVFTQAAIWNIDPFDQWGVELGKTLAVRTLEDMRDAHAAPTADSSTQGLIAYWRAHQETSP